MNKLGLSTVRREDGEGDGVEVEGEEEEEAAAAEAEAAAERAALHALDEPDSRDALSHTTDDSDTDGAYTIRYTLLKESYIN